MITEDFYGRKQFIWWTGIVEDVNDPLKIGSVRVRIIGVHSEDKKLVPTESLPWAQVMLPTNGANTTAGPREGDWVMGFFQDGEYAQIPVVMGLFPGIESVQSSIVYREAAAREGGPQNKPRPSQVDRVVGEPTTVRISRGILTGTLVNVTNQDRKHVCDISPEVTKATNYIRGKFGVVVEKIREFIVGLLSGIGSDPTGIFAWLLQQAKSVARKIKYITDIIKEVTELTKELLEVARQIRAMIDYILSLPEKVRKFLSSCLASFIKSLSTGIADLLSPPGVGIPVGDFTQLVTEFNKITQASKELLSEVAQLTTFPAQVLETLVNPASAEDVTAAGEKFTEFVSQIFPPENQDFKINTAQP
jgi:hypothetical protein